MGNWNGYLRDSEDRFYYKNCSSENGEMGSVMRPSHNLKKKWLGYSPTPIVAGGCQTVPSSDSEILYTDQSGNQINYCWLLICQAISVLKGESVAGRLEMRDRVSKGNHRQ